MKLCRFAKFLGCKANRKEFNTVMCSVDWAQVPLSKNSTRRHFVRRGLYPILLCTSNCVFLSGFMLLSQFARLLPVMGLVNPTI